MNYYGSICLSDIPKRLIKEVNGKKYLNIDVVEMKAVGKYGDTHFIAASCPQSERLEGENRFVGHLKPSTPKSVPVTPKEVGSTLTEDQNDDLPF